MAPARSSRDESNSFHVLVVVEGRRPSGTRTPFRFSGGKMVCAPGELRLSVGPVSAVEERARAAAVVLAPPEPLALEDVARVVGGAPVALAPETRTRLL